MDQLSIASYFQSWANVPYVFFKWKTFDSVHGQKLCWIWEWDDDGVVVDDDYDDALFSLEAHINLAHVSSRHYLVHSRRIYRPKRQLVDFIIYQSALDKIFLPFFLTLTLFIAIRRWTDFRYHRCGTWCKLNVLTWENRTK